MIRQQISTPMELIEEQIKALSGVSHRKMATCSGKISATCAMLGIKGKLMILAGTTLTDLGADIALGSDISFSEDLIVCALENSLLILSEEGPKTYQMQCRQAIAVGDQVIVTTDHGLQLLDRSANLIARLDPCDILWGYSGRLVAQTNDKVLLVKLENNKLTREREICIAQQVYPHGAGCLISCDNGYQIVNIVTGEVVETNNIVTGVEAQSISTFAYGLQVARQNPVVSKFLPSDNAALYPQKLMADAGFQFAKKVGEFSLYLLKDIIVITNDDKLILHGEHLSTANEGKVQPISSMVAILEYNQVFYHLNKFGVTFLRKKDRYNGHALVNGIIVEVERDSNQGYEYMGYRLKLIDHEGIAIIQPATKAVVCSFDDEYPDVQAAKLGIFFVFCSKDSGLLDVVSEKFEKVDEQQLRNVMNDHIALDNLLKMKYGQKFIQERQRLQPFIVPEQQKIEVPNDDIIEFESYCREKAKENRDYVQILISQIMIQNKTARNIVRRCKLTMLKNRIAIVSEKETLNVAEVM